LIIVVLLHGCSFCCHSDEGKSKGCAGWEGP
jgi:hypothetical protein